jgi:hypothetical protein
VGVNKNSIIKNLSQGIKTGKIHTTLTTQAGNLPTVTKKACASIPDVCPQAHHFGWQLWVTICSSLERKKKEDKITYESLTRA